MNFQLFLITKLLNIAKNSIKIIRILYHSISSISSIMFIFFKIINNYFNLFSNINLKFLINFFYINIIYKNKNISIS